MRAGLHSRAVGWLKLALPLSALAIFGSVVLIARDSDSTREIPFVTATGDDVARQRISRPDYRSVTRGGDEIALTADTVDPVEGDLRRLAVRNVEATVLTPGGRRIEARAPSGQIDLGGDRAEFFAPVTVATSDGIHAEADGLITAIGSLAAESTGPVRGRTPFGTLAAGGMVVATGPDGRAIVVFNAGVTLVYRPR